MTIGQQIIPPTLTEPGEIVKVLQAYVNAKPESQSWRDFYAGSAGQTLIELISGLAAFDNYNALMNRREGSRDEAVLDSSIREHAFNAGVLTGTSDTLELRLTLNVAAGQSATVTRGQFVGTIGDYELYALENKSSNTTFTLEVAAGFLTTIERQIEPLKFEKWIFPIDQEFVATSLERLVIEDEDVNVRSELSFTEKYDGTFMLRRVLPYEVRIYTGNGALGWLDTTARSLSYTVLGYNSDLRSVVNESPSISIANASLASFVKTKNPVYGIDKEELRVLSMYFPLNGTITQDRDYEAIIIKYFGGILYDVYSYNVDPDQIVRILISPEYDSDTHLPSIIDLVDSKRGAGILVTYETVEESTGFNIDLSLRVEDYAFYLQTRNAVIEYLNRKILKFVRETTVIKTQDLAVELTDKFNIKFFSNTNVTYTLDPGEFIQSFNLTVNV